MRTKNQTTENIETSEDNKVWAFLSNLPVSLGVSLAVFSVVTVFFLLVENFNLTNVVGVGLPLSLGALIIFNKVKTVSSPGSLAEKRFFGVLILLFTVSWGIFNLGYTAQTVYLYRDPGLYNSTARWLIDHNDIVIPAENPFGENPNLKTTSNSGVNMLPEDNTRLYTHGQRLLPALSALVGRVFQESAALKVNVLIGALALLSVFGFIRLIAKPRWAFLSTSVLAFSLPMLYFSRDMYTEPLSMLFFFTTLSLAFIAYKTSSKSAWLLVGLVAGATLLTRIDAYLAFAGYFAFLFFMICSSSKKNRKRELANSVFFLAGALLSGIVAWLDLTQLGTAYYRFHDKLIAQQLLLVGTVIVLGSAASLLYLYRPKFRDVWLKTKPRNLFLFASALVVICVVVLLARPYIINGERYYEVQNIGGTQSIVVQDSKTPDSTAYNIGERVALWPAWYLGFYPALIAVFGMILVLKDTIVRKQQVALFFILSFVPVVFLYLFKPAITPDHIWASRRLLPVILPGILVLTAYFMSSIKFSSKVFNALIFMVVSFIFLNGSLSASSFFLKEKINSGNLTQINEFCSRLPKDSAVLLVGIMGLVATQTVHSYCDVPTVRYIGSPTNEEYRIFYKYAISNQKVPMAAAFVNDKGLFTQPSLITNLTITDYKTVEKVFEKPPRKLIDTKKEIVYGFINEYGKLSN